jgi:restriction endonuclease S subunit
VSTMTSVEPVKIPEGYKQTEVGVTPEDWDVISIDHALNTKMILDQMDGNHGELYPKSHEFADFGIPYVGATDFNNGRVNFSSCKYLPLNRARLFKKGIAKHGDVLFAHNATVGPVALLDTEFEFVILSTTATYYRPDISQINNKYLASYFESQLFVNQYSSVMSQSTRNQVPILTQRKFKLVLPNIKEQTVIANAISDVDNLIVSLETLIAKKNAIKTATMQQLLTGKKRLPAFVKESAKQGEKQSSELENTSETAQAAQTKQASTLNIDLYKESGEGFDSKSNQHFDVGNANNKQTAPRPGYKHTELGEIPEDWEVAPLNEICSFGGGTTPARAQHDRYFINGSNNWVKTTDLNDSIIGDSEEQITDLALNETGLKLHPAGTVLVAMYGGFNQIGRTGFLTKPSAINQALVAVKPKPKKLDSYYLLSQLNYNVDYWKGVASSSRKDPNITSNDVKKYPIAFPTVKEQTAIANALSDMDTELDALQQRLSKTQKIKQGMMQELLTGKTRLI